MRQKERRRFLIQSLLREQKEYYGEISIPADEYSQRQLLRGLMNIRPAKESEKVFLHVQDEYLRCLLYTSSCIDIHMFTDNSSSCHFKTDSLFCDLSLFLSLIHISSLNVGCGYIFFFISSTVSPFATAVPKIEIISVALAHIISAPRTFRVSS